MQRRRGTGPVGFEVSIHVTAEPSLEHKGSRCKAWCFLLGIFCRRRVGIAKGVCDLSTMDNLIMSFILESNTKIIECTGCTPSVACEPKY